MNWRCRKCKGRGLVSDEAICERCAGLGEVKALNADEQAAETAALEEQTRTFTTWLAGALSPAPRRRR